MEERSAANPKVLELLSAVIRDVVRVQRLSAADGQDFAQTVHLKLLERNYDVLARFRGDSSLRTYLMVVVRRALLDWRNSRYGKWRPSAICARLGPDAVRLDTLISRDSYTVDAAIEIVRSTTDVSVERLRHLAEALPRRRKAQLLDEEHLRGVAGPDFPDPIEVEERRQLGRRVRQALAAAYRELPVDERKLLSLRYRSDLSVRQISDALQTDQKALYRRFDRVISKLRNAMRVQGPIDLSASF